MSRIVHCRSNVVAIYRRSQKFEGDQVVPLWLGWFIHKAFHFHSLVTIQTWPLYVIPCGLDVLMVSQVLAHSDQ